MKQLGVSPPSSKHTEQNISTVEINESFGGISCEVRTSVLGV